MLLARGGIAQRSGEERAVLQPHRDRATVQTRMDMGNIVLASLADAFAGRRPATSVTT